MPLRSCCPHGRAAQGRARSTGSKPGAAHHGLARATDLRPETERYLLFRPSRGCFRRWRRGAGVRVLDDLALGRRAVVALLKHVVRTVEQGALQVIADLPRLRSGRTTRSRVLADLRAVRGRAADCPARPWCRRGGADHDGCRRHELERWRQLAGEMQRRRTAIHSSWGDLAWPLGCVAHTREPLALERRARCGDRTARERARG